MPSLDGLSPEEKRALLLKLMKEPPSSGGTLWQQGITAWHQIIEPYVSNHNICCTLRHWRRSDPEMIRSRLQRVVDRHPILRTTYKLVAEDRVMQYVQPKHELAFTACDATGWSIEALHERMIADAKTPYDVTRLPVFRVFLYQREHDELLVMSMQHAAADLWSVEIIISELDNPPDGPPPPPFLAYATEQLTWLASPAGQAARAWWERQVEGAVAPGFGKTYFATPAHHIHFRIEPVLYDQIREALRLHRITLFNFLLSAVQVLMRENRQQDDVSIVSPAANRENLRYAQTCGFFAITLLYRQRITKSMTWRQLWDLNRTLIQEAVEHQGYPAMKVAPAMDFLFMFQKYQMTKWRPAPPDVEPLPLGSLGFTDSPFGRREFLRLEIPAAPFPVTLEAIDLGFAMSATLRYRITALPVPDRDAQQMVDRLLEMLAYAAKHPEATL